MDRPESGILLVLVMISGEKNRETQSHAVRARALHGGRRTAVDTGRRQTPAGAIHTHTGRQNTFGYGGPLTEGHEHGGTGEGRPLRATDKEEGKREGRPCINKSNNPGIHGVWGATELQWKLVHGGIMPASGHRELYGTCRGRLRENRLLPWAKL